MSATDQGRNFERERELIEAHNLDAAIRMFINRWTPRRDGARDFEADFVHIVQRIYREAQTPYIKAMTTVVMAQPMAPIVVAGRPDNT